MKLRCKRFALLNFEKGQEDSLLRLLSAPPGTQPYVGNPRSEENNPESRFLLTHFMNPCT